MIRLVRSTLPGRGRSAARTRVLLLIASLCATATSVAAQQARPIRALYVTGGGFHDFVAQEQIVPPGIATRTNIVWTIDHTAGKSTEMLIPRHQTTAWADSFDVVVYNMSFSYVVDPQWIERIAHAHRDKGVAAVILHGATHSYRRSTTDAWRELMGAASMRHDSQREFRLERMAADNPIVKSLPKDWGPGSDELYNIDRTWPTAMPLLQAWSTEGEKHHPIAWTNTHGKAKVFVTTMGHTNRTMSDPVYLDLVTRGLLWTVGKLAPDGTPVAGYGPRTATP
ncbi:MAG TPA: ThuA domain-containing protein [Gemmatimonadaceae bacterium]|nr:ThuA domain-containing protein [Gemmatimonadaceae bacterium]